MSSPAQTGGKQAEKTSNGKAAAPSGAAVAVSEAQPAKKTVEFKGLTIDLPAQIPALVLFDMTEIEVSPEDPMPMMRLLRSVVGADQFTEIRNRVPLDDDLVSVAELVGAVLEQYGSSLGESEASQDS